MPDTEDTRTYSIERWSEVHIAHHTTGLMTDERKLAWVKVGQVTLAETCAWSTCLRKWEDRQPTEPPAGIYRVIQDTDYGFVGKEFEIVERVSREIVPFEREQLRADLVVLSEAAMTPAPEATA